MDQPQTEHDVRKEAVQLIRDYIGSRAADLYTDFYTKSDEAVVLESISALLEEYVGAAKAAEILLSKGLKKPQ
jgi:uncharacterized protein YbcI